MRVGRAPKSDRRAQSKKTRGAWPRASRILIVRISEIPMRRSRRNNFLALTRARSNPAPLVAQYQIRLLYATFAGSDYRASYHLRTVVGAAPYTPNGARNTSTKPNVDAFSPRS